MHVSELLDFNKLNRLVEEKFISASPHPSGQLKIYNYTPRAQFTWRTPADWPTEALYARGLILDTEGNIIARPFRKFFNWSEWRGQIPCEEYRVTEKMDGSLGVLYKDPTDGQPAIATRGSFVSEQAQWATKTYRERYSGFPLEHNLSDYTYLFEIIYPANRIVVDYGSTEDLFLLTAIHNRSGWEHPSMLSGFKGPKVPEHSISNLDELFEIEAAKKANREGFVVAFMNGLRLKVKFEEYVRLHRIVTNVSNKTVWEFLKTGRSFDELLERVPDEFNDWLRKTIHDLQVAYDDIDTAAKNEYASVQARLEDKNDRKAFAMLANQSRYRDILFAMLDQKEYAERIWRRIQPDFRRPFKEVVE